MNSVYQVIGLSKQALHQYIQRQQLFEKRLSYMVIIMDELREQHPGCGLEKAYFALNPDFIGRDRFVDVFSELGYNIRRHRRFVRTTIPAHHKYKNLIEGMIVYTTNMVWQTDITYFPVNDTFCYIIFITDIFSRFIISYEVSDHMRAEANIAALKRAINKRDKDLTGLIHHSDKGSQYGDKEYIGLLNGNNIHISMGIKGQDNAYAERVNGIIKNEFLKYRTIKNLGDLKKATKQAVNYYNYHRTHKSLPGRISPATFEKNYVNQFKGYNLAELIYSHNPSQIKWKGLGSFNLEGISEPKIMCPINVNIN
jgi:transposase InsO family protein